MALLLLVRCRLVSRLSWCLPAGLHAVEASYVAASSLSALRAAIVRSVWSGRMQRANTPAVHNLLEWTLPITSSGLGFV